jgi:hypothetical protein
MALGLPEPLIEADNFSKPNGPPWPLTGIALPSFFIYTIIIVENLEHYFFFSVVIQMWYSFQRLEVPQTNLSHQY